MRRRALVFLLFCPACGLFDAEQDTRPGILTATNLEELGPDHDYFAWLVVEGEPVSLGPVSLEDDDEVEVAIGVEDAEVATEFFVTIEQEGEAGPSASVIAAGRFDANHGTLASSGDDNALGGDFTVASAAFVLDTPTSSVADDYAQGVWWHDPSGVEQALRLPELNDGWIYEGWVTVAGKRTSTGRFAGPAEDSDGAGRDAGPGSGYDAPGQDFVAMPMSLVGSTIEITVEPDPDTSDEPFFIEPFALEGILDAPPSTLTWMFGYGSAEVLSTVALELPFVAEEG